jgi:hypothetical protein
VKGSAGVAALMPQGRCDVGGASEAVQADHEVAQRGHDLRAGACTDAGQVLGEGHVADPVQTVLDLPVPADPRAELIGAALCGPRSVIV